jgi:hypothetical protein
VQEVEQGFGLPVIAVLRLRDLLAHLERNGESVTLGAVRAYRERYGTTPAGGAA